MVLSEKVDKQARLDRRSCQAYRSVDKKQGHGKFGWGDMNDEIEAQLVDLEEEKVLENTQK
ncbi:hypothetical protein DICPUDRAFT_92323 [Dictyostelium purpureum]|uniref:Hyaluronan/mRNA-binding protein domain-containing protein n=1 Tax=Dictyostelium purpureum TaxID=5786 RepID=F0ZQ78_DICPU|nr:uncharacterized protein DICPUDRAFT_92323 [Dictyostelium purpureum]EGC33889.1 hypothetical protein DICPUDRAFT_92323 [Dictyostelium purpureum]|eukprot:XP_003289572.1 hypothetical protein DICPUDRAFT_92323 [Dictyostelium purpureum]